MANVTRREQIVIELMRRLRTAYPHQVLERGFFKKAVDVFPSTYVLEEEGRRERDPRKKRGLYTVEFTVGVSQWYAGIERKQIYTKGNALLAELTGVIEYDELFCDELDENRPLVIDYEAVEEIVRVSDDNKMEVYVEYKFTYTEEAPWVQRLKGR